MDSGTQRCASVNIACEGCNFDFRRSVSREPAAGELVHHGSGQIADERATLAGERGFARWPWPAEMTTGRDVNRTAGSASRQARIRLGLRGHRGEGCEPRALRSGRPPTPRESKSLRIMLGGPCDNRSPIERRGARSTLRQGREHGGATHLALSHGIANMGARPDRHLQRG